MRLQNKKPARGGLWYAFGMWRFLLLSVLLLAGCARGFYKDGAEYKDFYSDLRQCEAETSPRWSFCGGAMCGAMAGAQNNRRNQCMMARGWEIRRSDPKFLP